MRYRRISIGGAVYFFTLNLADRSSFLLVEQVGDLREAVKAVRAAHPFEILAWVTMPDHLHTLWCLPENDADYPMRWSLIKAGFSRRIPKGEPVCASRKEKGERGIWQRRYWEHLIRDEPDLQRHIDYIHYNPVKHGYVQRAHEWAFSSIHKFRKLGWVGLDWGGVADDHGEFGE